jgi:hypothetical protein
MQELEEALQTLWELVHLRTWTTPWKSKKQLPLAINPGMEYLKI